MTAASHPDCLEPADERFTLSDREVRSLIGAAIAAPSADNRHAFAWEANGAAVRLFVQRPLDLMKPHERVLAWISLGAVSVNIELRAAELGLHLESAWHTDRVQEGLLAHLRFSRADAADPNLGDIARLIHARHSSRQLVFRGPALSESDSRRLEDEATRDGKASLSWLDTRNRRRRAAQLAHIAEALRFSEQELHQELFGAIRFDRGWKTSVATGIPSGALGLSGLERLSFPMLRKWGLQRVVNLVGMHHLVGFRAAGLPCRIAPHVFAISAPATGALQGAFDAGRALQRVWLRATQMGLAAQVFAASPLYARGDVAGVSPALVAKLRDGWADLCDGLLPFVVMRLGRASLNPVIAGRLEPEDLRRVP